MIDRIIARSVRRALDSVYETLRVVQPLSIRVVGWGKAVDPPIEAIVNQFSNDPRWQGAVYLSMHEDRDNKVARRYKADHPYPTSRNRYATEKLLRFLGKSDENTLVIAVNTGGGSAMLTSPEPPLDCEDIATIERILLSCHVNCRELRYFRAYTSRVKNGQLTSGIRKKALLTLVVSDDVISRGSKEAVQYVSSGPTYALDKGFNGFKSIRSMAAWKLLPYELRRKIRLVHKHMEPSELNGGVCILADNLDLLIELAEEIKSYSSVHIRPSPYFGAVEKVEQTLWDEFQTLSRSNKEDFIYIAGGECTVDVKGPGMGGRSQELAARLLLRALDAPNLIVIHCFGSDGRDFIPNVSGAWAQNSFLDRDTLRHKTKRALMESDTFMLHQELGRLINGGDWGTNVGDAVVLRKKG